MRWFQIEYTVHKDMSERLPALNNALSGEVRKVLDHNKAERHLRGGKATCLKYKNIKKRKSVDVCLSFPARAPVNGA